MTHMENRLRLSDLLPRRWEKFVRLQDQSGRR